MVIDKVVDWFDEPIKNSINSVFNGVNDYVESLDLIGRFRDSHYQILKSNVGSVKILGMQKPINLKELYYPAVVSTDIRRRIYSPDWEVISKRRSTSKGVRDSAVQADEYFSKNNKVVVLGGPGAGKTTLLKFLALAMTEKELFKTTKLSTSRLPVYVHLPAFARDGGSLIDYISTPVVERTDFHAFGFYKSIMASGKAVLLLDSLDEVPRAVRADVISKIENITSIYPNVGVVLSCRTADFDHVLNDFSEVELCRLTKDAVKKIVSVWFQGDVERGEKLLALLDSDEAVLALTETPLLLSLLCIQFRNDLALPKRKTELYRRCVDALLRDWDATRGFRRDTTYTQLSDDRKERLFEKIASGRDFESVTYVLSESSILTSISDELARFGIDPNESKGILCEIESHHGIVEKSSAETYEFVHGTMHEYFLARCICSRRKEIDVLKEHYEDEAWQNVILFMVSMLENPGDVLRFLQSKSVVGVLNYPAVGRRMAILLLLYRCLSVGVSICPELRKELCLHILAGQVDLFKLLAKDGVLPYAVRLPYGVRTMFFTYSKARKSIDKILQPYLKLLNDMVLAPACEYGDIVYSVVDGLMDEAVKKVDSREFYSGVGVVVSLLVPVSEHKPEVYKEKMDVLINEVVRRKAFVIKPPIFDSITLHKSKYPGLYV